MPWTPADVERRLKEAAWVLLLLPDPDRRYRLGTRSNAPEVVREAILAYGGGDPGLVSKDGGPVMVTVRDPGHPRKFIEIEVLIPKDSYVGPSARAREVLARNGFVPTEAIDRMDEVLPWFGLIRGRSKLETYLRQKVVWRRLTGVPWHNLADLALRSEDTVQRWYREALRQICDEIVTLEEAALAPRS